MRMTVLTRRQNVFFFAFFLLFLLLGLLTSVIAEEVTPFPEIQLVRVGNSLAAVDEISIATTGEEFIQGEAQQLEREIMLRKLAQQENLEPAALLTLAKPAAPKMETPTLSVPSLSLSSLSHESLFSDVDKEIVDPFRSGENFDNFMTRLLSFMDYSLGVYGEYDDNVFLIENNEVSDWKTIVNQSVEIKYPMDKFYFEALYAVNLDFYSKLDETVDTQNARGRISYYPFDHLSLGVSDDFTKVGESAIGTNFGDQTLTLGYTTNTLTTDMQYELWKNGFLKASWVFDHIDFDNDNIQQFINRDVHVIDTRLEHRFCPPFSNYFGHRYKDVQFYDFHLKDSQSNILFYGMQFEVPGILTWAGEVGYEQKSFEHTGGSVTILPFNITIPFEDRRNQDGNVNYRFVLESNFSRFNNISLSYDSKILESSRPEFVQYLSRTFAMNSRWFLDNKTILFKSLFLEFQDFEDDDAISAFFQGGAETKIYATGITLRRILTDWLYLDVGYTHIFRDTDFAGEKNRNNRFRFGARATF